MRPESFARWSPGTPRQHAGFIIRMGTESDVEACALLAVGIGAGAVADWRQTLTRTVRDGKQRALFVAEASGQVVGYGRVVCTDADPAVPGVAPPGWRGSRRVPGLSGGQVPRGPARCRGAAARVPARFPWMCAAAGLLMVQEWSVMRRA